MIVDQLVLSAPRPTFNNRLFVRFYKKKSQLRQFVVRRRFFLEETGSLPPDMAKWCQAYVKAAITPEPHLAFESHGIA